MKCRLKSKWHCWASDANMHSTGKGNVMKNGIEDELDDHDKNSIVQEVIPFPKGTIFILLSYFFDRFAFQGTRAILVIFLTRYLAFSSQDATALYHGSVTLIFLMCILGAIIADSWLGKFRTVIYMYSAYALGMVILIVTSIPVLDLPKRELTILALILVAIGAGSVKPCVISLGGDQFKLPQQRKQLDRFYSIIYMALKLSYLCATALTPILRNDVKCFGADHCFSLAFGVSGSFVVVGFVSFLLGVKWLVKRTPSENMVVLVSKCIWKAAILRFRNKDYESKQHWLDYAVPKFGQKLVNDTKVFLNIIVIFLPIPMFWALNGQTGSRWILQAASLNGDLGFYIIKPDQMQLLMPLSVLFWIGLLDFCMYPCLQRIGINSDLRRMVIGSFMAVLAFIIAGALDLHIQPTRAMQPLAGHSQVRLFNPFSSGIKVYSNASELNEIWVPPLDTFETDVRVTSSHMLDVRVEPDDKHVYISPFQMNLKSGKTISYLFQVNQTIVYEDSPSKENIGLARLRVLLREPSLNAISIIDLNNKNNVTFNHSESAHFLRPSKYRLTNNGTTVAELNLGSGSVTTVLCGSPSEAIGSKIIEITPSNSVHMLWMIPQFALLGLAETMLGVTGLRFAYSEAPESMKAVLQASWLLTVSFGHLIALIIVSVIFFKTEAYATFLFAALMLADSLWFMWLAKRYRRSDNEVPTDKLLRSE